jgi:putative flippase GtrA
MARAPVWGSLNRLWRYYQAGIVNTLFGFGLYALLLSFGIWMYAAQLIAHVLGVVFNYFTYSRHAFAGSQASKFRFVVSYGFNYLLGLGSLAAAAQVIESPYIAGIVSILFVSLVNYFVLKNLVFTRQVA